MAQDIDLSEAAAYFEYMSENVVRAARRGLVSAAMRGVQDIVTRIIPSRSPQPVDRGVYRAGWHYTVDGDNVWIENDEAYAPLIEYGVRPENVKVGAAMINALAEWGLRKGIVSTDEEAIGFAWAVAGKMKREGIFNRHGKRGLGILNELMNKRIRKFMKEEIRREVAKELNRGW